MTVDLQSTPLPLRTNSPKLAMVGGFEPPTSWLTANCSTAELHHQFGTASIFLLNSANRDGLVSARKRTATCTFR